MNARERAVAANIQDFKAVFAANSRFVWRVLARLGVQSRDLPDACQEVFLVVHRRLADFDASRGALTSWLYGICLRVASDYRRRHRKRGEAPLELVANAPGDPNLGAEGGQAWMRLARVLSQMGPDKGDVFVLYELEGLPMTEVASLVSCPLQTAYARLHAARRLVLAALKGEAP